MASLRECYMNLDINVHQLENVETALLRAPVFQAAVLQRQKAKQQESESARSREELQASLALLELANGFLLNDKPQTIEEGMDLDEDEKEDNEMVILGPGGTAVSKHEYAKMKIGDVKYTIAVRKLLRSLFSASELATHSQTGKESPAFKGLKQRKPQLNPVIVNDIRVHISSSYSLDVSHVNKAITIALADARKSKEVKHRTG
ncbi:hypothetical protein HHI36_022584 [Cryptolaemus montrouzieri]|uniref:BEN domain-containing protein n=1 Tax=Cryptolaemus montrouzieri TaxID=559131 RepID=A0ABD2N098_9CUCU